MKFRKYLVKLHMVDGAVLERYVALEEKEFSEDPVRESQIACDKFYCEKNTLYDGENGFHYPSFSVVKFEAYCIDRYEVPSE